jgi:hypothetical protein
MGHHGLELGVFKKTDQPIKPKNPEKTCSVWTGSQFGSGYINQECYFPVRLNFLVKTGPNRTVNTPIWNQPNMKTKANTHQDKHNKSLPSTPKNQGKYPHK